MPESYAGLLEPRFDDLDAMLKWRTIRVLVVHSKLFYFLDGGQQRGLTYDALQMFEADLNRKLKTGTLKLSVVPIPVATNCSVPWRLGAETSQPQGSRSRPSVPNTWLSRIRLQAAHPKWWSPAHRHQSCRR